MNDPERSAFKLSKPVFFIGLTSFFTDAASEIVYPLLPLFLTSVLGASALYVGLVEGVAESTASFGKYFFGWLSDRQKKRTRFVIGGYTLANTMRPLIGLATAPWQVLTLRFTDRIGKGMRTAPRDAWLAGLATPETRGRIYGFHRSMDHAGAVVGPILAAAFLYFYPGQLRPLFLWSIVPGLAGAFCVLLARRAHPSAEIPSSGTNSSISVAALPPALKPYLVILLIFTLAGSSDAFLLLKLSLVGIEGKWIPLLWSALHVVKSITSLAGGKLADSIGRKPSIVIGWLWYGAVYLALGFLTSPAAVIIVFLLYGIYYGLTESAERALVVDLVPNESLGRAFGLYNFVLGLGALPASLLFGYLWKETGPFTAFAVSAALAFSAALALLFWRADRTKTNQLKPHRPL